MKTTSIRVLALASGWLAAQLLSQPVAHAQGGSCVSPPAGLVSWWKAENNAVDLVSGNNGTLQGGATFAVGEVGQAFNFNGSDSYVQVPDAPSLRLTSELTVEFWIKRQQLTDDYIVNKGGDWTDGALNYGVGIAGPSNGNVLHFLYANGLQGTISITDFNWHHCAVTARHGDADATFYVDGVQQPVLLRKGPATINLYPSTAPLLIGAQVAPIANYFSGALVDELSLYSRVLTAAEIQALYTAGSAGKCAPTVVSAVPVISNIAPASGTNGTVVTLAGNNFSPTAANNIVYFGAVQANVLTASATSLTMTVPPGATFAPITVTVGGLTTATPQPFLPTFAGDGSGLSAASFAPRLDLAAGAGPIRVQLADLDGDGKPDLIVANDYNASLSLYRNISTNGLLTAGSFAPRVELAAPAGSYSPYGLVVADVDGDGKLDIVTTDYDLALVSVYRNTCPPGVISSNAFATRVDFTTGYQPQGVEVRDLDGDGRPELLVANSGAGTLSILRNTSTVGSLTPGSFAPKLDIVTGSLCSSVITADLDGDGLPDVMTANALGNSVSLLRNISSPGGLAFATRTDLPTANYPVRVLPVDLDGDGKLDLVISSGSGGQAVSVYRNTGTPGSLTPGSFASRVDFATAGWANDVTVGDLDGDGKPDLAAVTQLASQLALFRNTSTAGSFTASSLAARVDFSSGWNPNGVAVGDLDGDGRPEVLFCNSYDGSVSIYQNVTPFGGSPQITLQPANQTVTVGNSAAFSVVVVGTAPLSYQWQFNGTNISGATNTSLELFNVRLDQAGNYSVRVSHALDQVSSSNALLTVNPATCVLPPAGLVSWWRAESNVLDNVTGNHGTLEGGATFATGKAGSGFHFDGTNGFVQIPDSATLKPANVTIEAWVWLDPNVNTGPTTESIIFKRNSWTFLFEGYTIAKSDVDNGDGTYSSRFFSVITRDGNQVVISSTTVAQRGVWYHVAATYDGHTLTLFVNGAAEAAASPGFALDYGDRPVFIGSTGEPDPYRSMLAGVVDEAAIYDRALSTNEIAAIYKASSAGKCNVPIAPTIVVQPQDTTIPFNTAAVFNVVAGGSVPLSYQWLVNGAGLVGETNATLIVPNVQFNQSGNLYSVSITNAGGSMLSRNAVLTVINTPPQLAGLADVQVSYLAPSNTLAFAVSDAESPATSLIVTGASANTNLVSNEQIIIAGTDTNRTVTITANPNQVGTAVITLVVIDPGGQSNQVSFNFSVTNATPQISTIAAQRAPLNATIGPLAFTVSDVETPADQLVVTARSSNNSIVPTNQIVLGGSGTNRTVTLLPGTNAPGSATVTLTVTDALGGTAMRNFAVTWDAFTDMLAGLPSLQYSAVAWGDYDNDGKLDLLVSGTTNGLQSGAVTRIYHNDGGVFTNFISLPGLFKCALAWSDYDRDGWLDIAINGLNSTNQAFSRIYHNNGNGTFTELNAGLTGCYAGTMAWGDFNNDGAADLFLSGIVTTTNVTGVTSTNILRLYRNDGNGGFTDMNLLSMITIGGTLGPINGTASWGDYDNDGRPDLLLVGQATAIIYRNLGNGAFTNAFSSAVLSSSLAAAGAWGDYDNDGWLDFALSGSGATYIFHNNRNGTFTQIANLPSGTTPSVAWGDYNNDGYLDLIIGGNPSRLYRNNGNGTFTDTQTPLLGMYNGALAWGDYDNDGDLDLLYIWAQQTLLLRNNSGVANTRPAPPTNLAAVTALTNSVVLTWAKSVDAQTSSNGLSYNLRVGTTEGGVDIVSPLANPTTGLRRVAALGNAGPTNRALLINLPQGTYYWSVQAIDTSFAGSTFPEAISGGLDFSFTINNARPVISDIPDLTIAPGTNSPGPAIPFTIGDAETFASTLVVTVRSSNTNVVAATNMVIVRGVPNNNFPSNCTVRVTARTNGTSVITVTVSDKNGAFASDNFTVKAEAFTLVSTNFVQVQNSLVAWGDYDNDGRLDVLIAGNTNGSTVLPPVTRLYHNDGNGVFTPVATTLPNVTLGSAAWGDFNNDGWLDLVLTGTTNGNMQGSLARIYRNNGDGTFTDINAGLPRPIFNCAVAWGDADNDGWLDLLLTGTTNGTLGAFSRIYRNNHDGTFSNYVSFTGVYQGAVAFADLDGDGDLDVVIAGVGASSTTVAQVYRNNGGGSFTLMSSSLPAVYNCALSIGDFDNDGRPDILLAGYTGSTYLSRVYRNNGNFSFTDVVAELPGARYASATFGDFDNDGLLDILLSGTSNGAASGGFTRLYRNGGGIFNTKAFSYYPTTLPTNYLGAVTWADFDNDGKLDIFLTGTDGTLTGQQSTRSQTALFHNNSGVSNTPPTAPTVLSAVRSNNVVALTWAKSTDAQTRTLIPVAGAPFPSITNYDGLKYQLRVGTTPGGLQTESPLADLATGYRRVVRTGDASTNRWQLQNLPPGTYYWSVQAIDTAFAGSPFAQENSFIVTHPSVAVTDAVSTPTNTPANFASAKLAVNDLSPDGYSLTVISVSPISPRGGTVSLASARITYTPPADFSGNDSFTYTVSDGLGGTATGSVIVTVGNGGLISLNIVYGPVVVGGDFVVRFAGIPGFTYTVEWTDNLNTTWFKAGNLTAPTTDTGFGIGIFEFRQPMVGNRFFRTVYPAY